MKIDKSQVAKKALDLIFELLDDIYAYEGADSDNFINLILLGEIRGITEMGRALTEEETEE